MSESEARREPLMTFESTPYTPKERELKAFIDANMAAAMGEIQSMSKENAVRFFEGDEAAAAFRADEERRKILRHFIGCPGGLACECADYTEASPGKGAAADALADELLEDLLGRIDRGELLAFKMPKSRKTLAEGGFAIVTKYRSAGVSRPS